MLGPHQEITTRPLFHRCNKAVSAARKGLDEARFLWRISERFPNFGDRRVQAVVEVYKRVGGPEVETQLLAAYDLARVLRQ